MHKAYFIIPLVILGISLQTRAMEQGTTIVKSITNDSNELIYITYYQDKCLKDELLGATKDIFNVSIQVPTSAGYAITLGTKKGFFKLFKDSHDEIGLASVYSYGRAYIIGDFLHVTSPTSTVPASTKLIEIVIESDGTPTLRSTDK